MAEQVKAGRFREDLYYRINVMSLELPPLRARQGDIPLLVARFLGPDWDIEQDALNALNHYSWPGNVRQLINAIDRAKILGDDNRVRLDDLPAEIVHASAPTANGAPRAPDSLEEIERAHVCEVLQRENGNKARAARALGINRRSLYRLLEKYGLE
jgi:transcriptional regulator of acetoin/glycerol metabolism